MTPAVAARDESGALRCRLLRLADVASCTDQCMNNVCYAIAFSMTCIFVMLACGLSPTLQLGRGGGRRGREKPPPFGGSATAASQRAPLQDDADDVDAVGADGASVLPTSAAPRSEQDVQARHATLASLVSAGATFYGAAWCGFTTKQLAELGITEADTRGLKYVDCDARPAVCRDRRIEAFPTWEIGEQMYAGYHSLAELAALASRRAGTEAAPAPGSAS